MIPYVVGVGSDMYMMLYVYTLGWQCSFMIRLYVVLAYGLGLSVTFLKLSGTMFNYGNILLLFNVITNVLPNVSPYCVDRSV